MEASNQTAILNASTSRQLCETWPDGNRQCPAPGSRQSLRSGAWVCETHYRRWAAMALDFDTRLGAALAQPLPSVEQAVEQLRRSGREWGMGLPADWAPEPATERSQTPDGHVFCGTCWGYRWLREEGDGAARWVTQLRRCHGCADTQRAERRNRIAEMAGLSERQRTKTFATFRPVSGGTKAVAAVAAWADQPDGWLVLHGINGSGKTHLQLAAANRLVEQERAFKWWYAADLINAAKELMDNHLHHQFLADLKREAILFVDDLGTIRPTDWVLSDILEPLLDARYRDRRPTCITCVGDPERLKAAFSQSIGRRMQDESVTRVVHNAAPQWELRR